MTTLHLFNEYHLGDCIFVCIYFYWIREYIEKNHIDIVFYILPEHIQQVQEFIPSKNIRLEDLAHKKGITTWIGSDEYSCHFRNCEMQDSRVIFDLFLAKFLSQVFMERLNIPIIMTEFVYEDPDLLERYARLDTKYHDIDILIVNSDPYSGQVLHIDEVGTNNYIHQLQKKYKIVTTKKIEGVPCTRDDNLTLKGIAAVSTRAKIIMAYNTGPVVGMMNQYTLEYMRQFYVIVFNCCFQNKKFKNVDYFYTIKTEELDGLLAPI